MPVIYANDNFGYWLSNFDHVLRRCTEPDARGREIACQLAPTAQDYILLKLKHSAFFQTPLDLLLKNLGTERLICVPSDCVSALAIEEHTSALKHENGHEIGHFPFAGIAIRVSHSTMSRFGTHH